MKEAEEPTRYNHNGTTASAVNFLEEVLPEHDGKYRLVNLHQNIPGVIGASNLVFGKNNVNVSGQYLQTMGDRVTWLSTSRQSIQTPSLRA